MRIAGCLSRLRRQDSGAATIEFALLFPIVIYIFMLSFELGLWNIRDLMLRQAVNHVVRDVRLSTGDPPSYEEMKTAICARSLFESGCLGALRIEMRALPLDQWDDISEPTACVDREEKVDPLKHFKPGQQNELMIVRVCRLYDPLLPGAGLGRRLSENSEGEYGVRVVTGFVTEPLS